MVTDDIVNEMRKETYPFPQRFNGDNPFMDSHQLVGAIIVPFWADTESSSRFYKVTALFGFHWYTLPRLHIL